MILRICNLRTEIQIQKTEHSGQHQALVYEHSYASRVPTERCKGEFGRSCNSSRLNSVDFPALSVTNLRPNCPHHSSSKPQALKVQLFQPRKLGLLCAGESDKSMQDQTFSGNETSFRDLPYALDLCTLVAENCFVFSPQDSRHVEASKNRALKAL